MEVFLREYKISSNQDLISVDRVCELLKQSYWADKRSREKIEASIKNSVGIGIYDKAKMIGFARIVTDHATMYWLCDVIIDEAYRGNGLGKKLIECITGMEELKGMFGILATRDAHGLYEKYGFKREPEKYMRRDAD
ncbi:MAG TPA: GNAT family N-acetyltransferase [Firmicutes bacterium]|jgi:predicted GNAT family N-acyltransferase|nr:GNAT family N-acetyltransferase [Bacillota bacterium]